MSDRLQILIGDCRETLKTLATESVHCVITSPPYFGLRSYLPDHHPNKIFEFGSEKTPDEFVENLVNLFREIRRILRNDGTVWLNLGDSFNSKNLLLMPARVALALQADGWYLRSDIVWSKPNPMPESVIDRPTRSHEFIFLITKSAKYFYDAEAIKEPASEFDWSSRLERADVAHKTNPTAQRNSIRARGLENNFGSTLSGGAYERHNLGNELPVSERRILSTKKPRGAAKPHIGLTENWDVISKMEQCNGFRNKRDVWTICPAQYPEAHFATFPPELISPCILAGTSAAGCCPKCFSSWKRLVEKCGEIKCKNGTQWKAKKQIIEQRGNSSLKTSMHTKNSINQYATSGWEPTCGCDILETIPCTVLDPFGGSGTTGQVALELSRRAILCELNENYLPLMETRMKVTMGLRLA